MSFSLGRIAPCEFAEVFSGFDVCFYVDWLNEDFATQRVKLRPYKKRVNLRAIYANLHRDLRFPRSRSMPHAKQNLPGFQGAVGLDQFAAQRHHGVQIQKHGSLVGQPDLPVVRREVDARTQIGDVGQDAASRG